MTSINLSTCKRICQHRFIMEAVKHEDPHKGCPIQDICMYCFEQPPYYWNDDMIAENTMRGREYMKGVYKDEQHNDGTVNG